jgi:ATP-dependent helicase HrpA
MPRQTDGRMPRRPTAHPRRPEEVERRRALIPEPRYPADLPIADRRGDILAALAAHQVVVVAGETGSGKSTQLPKLCLELGRGAEGWIGHTQPRRIAARSIAERVAEELGTDLGGLVGYAVRFTDEVGPDTLVKVMTDGILLAEVQRDPDLRRYDTLIIDEAHERSLNIDFLLGYLKRLLPRRPDLKVVITSATIDTARFSAHFDDAPVVEVSGRTYPVDLRYRPLEDPDSADPGTGRIVAKDQVQGIVDAVAELRREGPGDVLVFCAGERDIRDAADALREQNLPDTEILPLYARLSSADQHRVFASHRGRRIVLATNVAETSLTVPGIRYVVDPGQARISRYNHRTKVQRLPIEAVSQASADQRAGRCGRVGPGVCIRLYSEEDFDSRPRFTEPEIQRTNLASVVLQMASLGLGAVADFPFVDPPDVRAVRDGIAVLVELGALDDDGEATPRLTPLGRQLARIPLDPRLGRMVLDADRAGCLHEVMVIVAALSIIDPRERPAGEEQAADALHARFRHPDSDFMAYIALWDHVRGLRDGRSSSAVRRQLRAEHLHVMRIREWQDLYAQIRRVANQMGMRTRHGGDPPDADTIHRALLGGLLSHVGMKVHDSRDYRGARNARFAIARGSSLARSGPRWIVAGELVETNRMWARTVARIRPEWIEDVGDHLVARTYGEPWWEPEQGAALCLERVTLFGLPVVAGRTTNVARVDPDLAREMFVLHALVRGEWAGRHDFVARNAATAEAVHDLESRVRRDLLTTEDALFSWFDERIPDQVVSVRAFDRWWRDARRSDPALLDIPFDVLAGDDGGLVAEDFPDVWTTPVSDLAVDYEFDPTSPTDGVAVEVPLGALRHIDPAPFEWNVPGVRHDLVDALLRSLPKTLRRPFVPVPDTVADVVPQLREDRGVGLLDALAHELTRRGPERISAADFDLDKVPDHLRTTFVVVDEDGAALAHGKSLEALTDLLDERIRAAVADAAADLERTGLTEWPGGDIPRVVRTGPTNHPITAYPALVDEGSSVALRLLPDADEQWVAMWSGTRRLLALGSPAPTRAAARMITNRTALALAVSPWRSDLDWAADLVGAALDAVIDAAGGPAWTQAGFEALEAASRAQVAAALAEVAPAAVEVLHLLGRIEPRLGAMDQPALAPTVADVRRQLDRLVYPGVLTAVGVGRIPHLRRYLAAIDHRLDRAPEDLRRDHERMVACRRLENEHDALADRHGVSVEIDDIGWMLQELRVASFAQHLGTDGPVSEKRIRTALAAAAGP